MLYPTDVPTALLFLFSKKAPVMHFKHGGLETMFHRCTLYNCSMDNDNVN